MKILVLGSNGQLGFCLRNQLDTSNNEIIFATRNDIDLCDLNSINKKILLIRPEIIINAAAYTQVDDAETNSDMAYSINHIAVKRLANLANQLDCWLFHISTDYVFDGLGNKPYVENDIVNPMSVYGRSKLLGENEIQSSKCKYIILRTSWVFSEYGKNFLKTMISLCGKKNEVNIVSDALHMLKILEKLSTRWY
jgi:dTDP-4-dehydrorhamnose reductase